jgi:carboxypeptidase T
MKTIHNRGRTLSLLLVLFILSWSPAPSLKPISPAPEEEPVVARVYFADWEALNRLAGELDVWEVHHEEGYLLALLRPDQRAALLRAGYRVEIDEAKTALLARPLHPLVGQMAGIPGYPCYRTVEETYADLAQLAADHPGLASWIDIGDSWDKITPGGPAGYDIYALALTNNAMPAPKPRFFLMAEIHARELATAELATRFAEHLVANYGTDPDITWLLDYFEIHIVPMTNPDGRKRAEQGYSWRKNTDNDDGCVTFPYYGTDLNRNSSFKWNQCAGSGCSSGAACSVTYRGPGPASEPETQAIQNYVASIFPSQLGSAGNEPSPNDAEYKLFLPFIIKQRSPGDLVPDDATGVFITLHSYGRQVLFPWGWTLSPAPNSSQLETLGRKFGYFTDYEVCQTGEPGCLYLADGTTDDWAYGQPGLAAYTFELGTAFFQGCSYFESTVVAGSFPALLYAFKAARRPYQAPAGPESLQVAVTPTTVVAGAPVTLTAVADDTRYDSNGWGNEPVQQIAAARHTVDGPSWATGAISYALAPADGAFDAPVETVQAVVDTTGWTVGRHLLLVESLDAAGNWGVPGAVFLWVEEENYAVALNPASTAAYAEPGQTITYTLRATNAGNTTDTFDVSAIGYTWPTTAPATVGPLAAGASAALTVTVSVPITAADGDSDTAIVTLTSQGDGSKSAASSLTTTVGKCSLFLPLIIKWDIAASAPP